MGFFPVILWRRKKKKTIQEAEQEVELGPNIKRLQTNDDIRTLFNDHPVEKDNCTHHL